jgi:metallo-beta-lactamase class B
MKRTPILISAFAAVLVSTMSAAQAPTSDVDAHIATAKAAAGQEYRATFVNLCLPAAPRAGGLARQVEEQRPRDAPQPSSHTGSSGMVRVASQGVRQFLLARHAPALILGAAHQRRHHLIDTNFAWATQPEIIDGLTALGLDPRQIKYVVISHAHGDHDQGAAELQRRYGAKVVMGAADWESTLQRPASAAGGVPKRDVAVAPEGSTKITLGDTTMTVVPTPGHTPGTLSYVFPVKDQGRTVMVAYSGGTLTGAFGTDGTRWDEYIASQKAIAKVAADAGATVLLSNHSEYDGAYTKARLVPVKREVGENHPFIVGADGVQRYFTVMAECALASKLRLGAKP